MGTETAEERNKKEQDAKERKSKQLQEASQHSEGALSSDREARVCNGDDGMARFSPTSTHALQAERWTKADTWSRGQDRPVVSQRLRVCVCEHGRICWARHATRCHISCNSQTVADPSKCRAGRLCVGLRLA
ncbi:hypothetical protein CDD83_2030 [Cordyceps sp. RAO-2017]|nr:hypothetical protein CDD83_2030 [Cordyceps sp. RAO-2017]